MADAPSTIITPVQGFIGSCSLCGAVSPQVRGAEIDARVDVHAHMEIVHAAPVPGSSDG